jgi:hypothetical protein
MRTHDGALFSLTRVNHGRLNQFHSHAFNRLMTLSLAGAPSALMMRLPVKGRRFGEIRE